jgi:hypothetical protein
MRPVSHEAGDDICDRSHAAAMHGPPGRGSCERECYTASLYHLWQSRWPPPAKIEGLPAAAFLTRKLMQNFEDPYPQGGAKKSGRANQNGLFFPLQPWL